MRARVILAAAAALAATAAPTTAHAQEFTKKALTIPVVVGPNDDVRCNVSANLFTPAGVTASNPAPAVMGTNGFGGSKADFDRLGAAYARRGYVFLAYSGLGFGGSGCKIQLDDPDYDGKAGSQIVTHLAGLGEVVRDKPGDPRVGMIGGSYGGEIQFSIAGQDPRLDALVPQITWNDLSYSLTGNNTDFEYGVTSRTPGVSKIDWPAAFFGIGVANTITGGSPTDPSHLGTCPNFDDRVCPSLVTSATLGFPDASTIALLRHASVATYMNRIRVPTLLAQGQHDTLFNLQEAVATYKALYAQGTPVKLLWRSAGHSGGTIAGESDADNPETAYESRMALEWFDYYLRGIGDAPKLDFTFLRDWAPYTGDAAPAVGRTPSYPAGTSRSLFLSGAGALVDSAPAVQSGSAQFAVIPGAQTGSGGGVTGQGVNEAPGTFASWTSAPLGEDTDVVGVPRLTVKVDAPAHALSQAGGPAGMLVLFAKLIDVDPAAGTSTLPKRQLSAVRIPDVTKPVTIELPGVAHRFAKGHQIRLTLATSSAVYRNSNVAGPVTVRVDPAAPSELTIPVLGDQKGATGAGPGGTTNFESSPEAPKPQPPGLGYKGATTPRAARLPSARRCLSRRVFRIHLRRPAKRLGRVKTVRVTVNGKRVKVRRGKRLSARVDLRGMPKGTVRVMITVRTTKGRTLRSARTYRTCVPRKKRS